MKTPKQIAKDELKNIGLDSVDDIDDWSHLERITASVIEADRAQRADDLKILADAAANWVTELTDYIIPDSSAGEDQLLTRERDKIQAALDRYLDGELS